VRYGILGSLTVWDGDLELSLGGPRQRALLAVLLLRANELVPTARLVDELWGERPPPTAVKTVQVYVSQLRKVLGEKAIETRAAGYLLRVDPGALDARRFEQLLERGRQLQADGAAEEAAGVLREALGLWRGPVLAEFQYESFAREAIGRLEELRVVALEQRLTADLALGRHAEAVPELEALVHEHPLRESLRRLLMLALYRSGRQADALGAYQAARKELVDELGLEPSQALQQLEKAILVQDSSLDLPAAVPPERARKPAASPDTAPCLRCGRANSADARFCQSCGAVLEREQPAETRKTVTVLACEPVTAETHDPEALRRVQLATFDRAALVLGRHGANVENFVGDAVVAVFGVPHVREDDALRAVRAAYELTRAARDPEVRVGICTGEVMVGGLDFVTGEPVSGARRLAHAARAGEVLLAAETYALVAHAVEGDAHPEGALSLTSVKVGAPAFPRRDRTPLVDRTRELAQVEALFSQVAAGEGARLVTLVGDAGIGKSRLARELLARIGGEANVCIGSCPPYGEGVTFAPLGLLLPEAELAGSSHEVFAAARRALERLAEERPAVAAFEDVHWAEPTFLDLVEYLAGRLGQARVLLLCLARPDLGDRRPAWLRDAIMLEPLSKKDSEQLVDELGVADDVRARIADAAEGNPLFVEQLAAIADTSGVLPASIRGVLWERIDRLGREERAVLERAAVVGRSFALSAVVDLSSPDTVDDVQARLLELVRKGLLRPDPFSTDDGFRFQHALLRDAAYEGMPKASRAALHVRVAERLETTGDDEALIGYHLEQAVRCYDELGRIDDERNELAARAGRRLGFAGGRARARGDLPAAAALLERAAAVLAENDVQLAPFLTELGSVLIGVGNFADAETALERALAVARAVGDRRSELRAALEQQFLASFTAPTEARDVEVAERVMPDLEAIGDDLGLAKAWWLRSEGDAIACRWRARAEALERALTHAQRATDVRDEAGTITALLAQALYFGSTPVPDAIARCEELLAGVGGDRPLRAALASTLGGLLAMQADSRGRELYDDAIAIYDELGLRFRRSARAHIGAQIALLAGDASAAERELRDALDALSEIGARGVHATLATVLADMLAELGRDEEAEALLAEVEDAVEPDDLAPQVLRRAALARVLAHRDEPERARDVAAEALRLTEAVDFPDLRARALLAAADVTGDLGFLEEAGRVYRAKGNVAALGARLAFREHAE
jgi:DNA-binding SARP family transcriptional activator/class 3 adenylate cyclase